MELVLHEHTKEQLERFAHRPGHAILITGPAGIGKSAIAAYLAELLLELAPGNLSKYPHIQRIQTTDGKAIGIDAVRELEHFLSLKIPGNKPIARIAIVEDAHLLSHEAQNSLLKTLEEPPADTVLILTTVHEHALLPTVRSRAQSIAVNKPGESELASYFMGTKPEQIVTQALAISGGMPGLTASLLDETAEHPLAEAVRYSRELLQKSAFERLLLVDELAKRKDLARDICYILGHMAQLALSKSSNTRWQTVMRAAYEADEALANSVQPKLALTNLMLQL